MDFFTIKSKSGNH